jgi:hypothetical protein
MSLLRLILSELLCAALLLLIGTLAVCVLPIGLLIVALMEISDGLEEWGRRR